MVYSSGRMSNSPTNHKACKYNSIIEQVDNIGGIFLCQFNNVEVWGGTGINLYNTYKVIWDNQDILFRIGSGLVAQVGLECKTFLLSHSSSL